MATSNTKLIGWARLIGFLGFLLGLGIAVLEATRGAKTIGPYVPALMLIVGGAVVFVWGAYLPKLLKQ